MIRNLLRRLGPLVLLLALPHMAFADMLDNAQNYLAYLGFPVPSGYTVRWGTDTASGAPGEVKPNDPGDMSQGGVIVINPEGIKALSPNLSGDVSQLGGVLVVVLYHEIRHAEGAYGNDPCSEVLLQREVFEEHCILVCSILDEVPSADVSPLCTLYEDAQERFNEGVVVPGGASTVWSRSDCPGPYPGDIEDCSCCP